MKPYVWQQSWWQQVQSQREQSRLAHAWLLYGPEGLGKLHFAHCVAIALLCLTPTSGGIACGECRACQLFLGESHPDFYCVTPVDKSKAIKIEQVRELIERLTATSMQGGKRVAILAPAESMNRACSNALLKTLEEPVGDTVILLVANQLGELPETIISRCQRLYVQAPERELAVNWLVEQLSIDRIEAHRLLHLSRGAPRQALQLAEQAGLGLRDEVLQTLLQLLQGQTWVSEASKKLVSHDVTQVISILFSLTHDLLRIRLGIAEQQLDNQDKYITLQRLSTRVELMALADQLPQLLQAKERSRSIASINLALLVEGTLLRWLKMSEAQAVC